MFPSNVFGELWSVFPFSVGLFEQVDTVLAEIGCHQITCIMTPEAQVFLLNEDGRIVLE